MNPPNVLFILADDLGWTDLSCYGSTFYETPNLDRLAQESMRFTQAYAAAPVCSPTRASIMTGKYPARLGLTNFIGETARGRLIDAPYIDHLPLNEVSLARALHEGGYATWHVGKWHLGRPPFYPENHGFEVNIGGCHWSRPRYGYFSPWRIENLPDGPEGEFLTDRLTHEAIRLIMGHRGRPFFLNMWYYAVHTPIEAKEAYVEKYRAKARRLGLDRLPALEEGEFFPCAHKSDQRVVRRRLQSDPTYAAMVEILDENIGRLLRALEEAGHAGNTVVVFTSDNGGLATAEGSPTCNAPLRDGKGWAYEGGIRDALIVRWPGVTAPNSLCKTAITSPDFYPTLLDIAGLPPRPGQHSDGVSFAALLRGEEHLGREAIYWHYPHYGNQGGTPSSAIRVGGHKLIEFFEDNRLELYDLRADLGEQDNLADCDLALARDMQRMLEDWRRHVSATMPTRGPAAST